MKQIAAALLIISLSSCILQQPVASQTAVNNQDYKVDYLFEHEGCKVYRFADRGYVVYFTNCNGNAIAKTDSTTITNSTHIYKSQP
jgi:hypothetical protein